MDRPRARVKAHTPGKSEGIVLAVDDAGIASECRGIQWSCRVRFGDLIFDGKTQPETRDRLVTGIEQFTEEDHITMMRAQWEFTSSPISNPPNGPIDMAMAALCIALDYGCIMAEHFGMFAWAGEMNKFGQFLPLNNPLAVAFAAEKAGAQFLVVPAESAPVCAATGLRVIGVADYGELALMMMGDEGAYMPEPSMDYEQDDFMDIAFVKGQTKARRALEIAVAGGHNLLLIGPPGEGKSLLAKCAGGIAPPLSSEESLEVSAIHQAAGKTDKLLHWRPVRMVDPTVTKQALIGGGHKIPYPGEVTLAHNGVLFIDEILQCSKGTIEALRGPMQDGIVSISRTEWKQEFPAEFQLIAAANPCPCGYYKHPDRECVCGTVLRERYMQKMSGPLLDRIPLRVFVQPLTMEEKMSPAQAENSATVRERVAAARETQHERYADVEKSACNDDLNPSIMHLVGLSESGEIALRRGAEKMKLSSRGVDNTLKVSRTIADLAGAPYVEGEHVTEAIQYLDWTYEG
jgi:magnesium chelatase family protein